MQVLKANDGFLWADVTHIAKVYGAVKNLNCMPYMMTNVNTFYIGKANLKAL